MYAEVLKIFNKYGVQETLTPYWDRYLSKHLINEVYFGYSYVDRDNLYQFPDVQALEGKKIILYGAGKVGYNYYKQLSPYANIKIVDWVDKNFSTYHYMERKVNDLAGLKKSAYDLVLIAVSEKAVADKIKDELCSEGVDENKICWREPIKTMYWQYRQDL